MTGYHPVSQPTADWRQQSRRDSPGRPGTAGKRDSSQPDCRGGRRNTIKSRNRQPKRCSSLGHLLKDTEPSAGQSFPGDAVPRTLTGTRADRGCAGIFSPTLTPQKKSVCVYAWGVQFAFQWGRSAQMLRGGEIPQNRGQLGCKSSGLLRWSEHSPSSRTAGKQQDTESRESQCCREETAPSISFSSSKSEGERRPWG